MRSGRSTRRGQRLAQLYELETKSAGVYAHAVPDKHLNSHRYVCDAQGFVRNQWGVE